VDQTLTVAVLYGLTYLELLEFSGLMTAVIDASSWLKVFLRRQTALQ
jgi:hypothetical protein